MIQIRIRHLDVFIKIQPKHKIGSPYNRGLFNLENHNRRLLLLMKSQQQHNSCIHLNTI